MKVVANVVTYKRPFILPSAIHHLRQQRGYTIDPILVIGSCEEDRKTAESLGCVYVHASNDLSLGSKSQIGINESKNFDPDFLLWTGDDEWLTPNWCEFFIPCFEEYDMVGTGIVYLLRVLPKENLRLARLDIFKHNFDHQHYLTEPSGPGRIWSRKALDMVNWNVFPNVTGLAGAPKKKVEAAGGKVLWYKGENAKMLGIKGPWEVLSTFDKFVRVKRDAPEFFHYDEIDPWLKENFPYYFDWIKENQNGITA